ncbi:MAG: aminotransferase class III-fold pyridoxal phosphate-dependent enzyme [Actinomycetota bacterium]
MSQQSGSLSATEIVELSKRYTMYDWTTQAKASPIAVAKAEGVYFWDVDGKRYLDLNSQLMSVNIGHGNRKVIEAIQRQAEKLPFISPLLAYEERAILGRKLAGLWPGDIEKSFFSLGGAEANENAIKIARLVQGPGRFKILARYRSYHGATTGAMTLTGDPRRWPNEPGLPGVVHVLDPYHGPQGPVDDAETSLRLLEETIQLEGPDTIAAFILETVVGTNGILIPPDGYLEGVRELCTRYGILMIADEVMCGWGRCGEWFAVNRWNVVPDIITTAKGLTSSYAPLGAVGLRPEVADHFTDNVFWSGLTYNTHPLGVAAAIAAIEVLEEEHLIERARELDPVLRRHHEQLAERHPSVGLHRNIGLFGILELVKDRDTMEPLSPFNTMNDTMIAINRFLLDNGVATFVRWHTIMTNPPLIISEEELASAFEVLDKALEIADQAMDGG